MRAFFKSYLYYSRLSGSISIFHELGKLRSFSYKPGSLFGHLPACSFKRMCEVYSPFILAMKAVYGMGSQTERSLVMTSISSFNFFLSSEAQESFISCLKGGYPRDFRSSISSL